MLVLLWVHPKVGFPTPPMTPDLHKLLSLEAQGMNGRGRVCPFLEGGMQRKPGTALGPVPAPSLPGLAPGSVCTAGAEP